jgi:hypothetical protein
MSSPVSNNVCQQSQDSMIEDIIKSWKNVTVLIKKLMKVTSAHHQSRIALYKAKKELQSVELSVREQLIVSLRGQNRAADRDRVVKENLLKDLVEECAKRVQTDYNRIRSVLEDIIEAATKAYDKTWIWFESIQDQFMSKIRAVVTTAITVTDMVSLLQSLEKIFDKFSEAEFFLKEAHKFWVQSAHNRLMSTNVDTLIDGKADATINTVRDMFPLMQACVKTTQKARHAAYFFNQMSAPTSKPITGPDDKPDYYVTYSTAASFSPPKYSLINDIQPVIAEVIKAAEETSKLFSLPDKSGTQTA